MNTARQAHSLYKPRTCTYNSGRVCVGVCTCVRTLIHRDLQTAQDKRQRATTEDQVAGRSAFHLHLLWQKLRHVQGLWCLPVRPYKPELQFQDFGSCSQTASEWVMQLCGPRPEENTQRNDTIRYKFDDASCICSRDNPGPPKSFCLLGSSTLKGPKPYLKPPKGTLLLLEGFGLSKLRLEKV